MSKGYLYIFVALFCFTCCTSEQPSPIEAALRDKMVEIQPSISKLDIENIKNTETVTLGRELKLRRSVFNAKKRTEESLYEGYKKDHMLKNAKRHKDKAKQASSILFELDKYLQDPNLDLNKVVYYVVTFECSGKTVDGAKIPKTTRQATITPDFKVYNLSAVGSDPFLGMGFVIPGYEAILDRYSMEE